jgi:signal peptidase I
MIPYIVLFIVIATWFACLPAIFKKAGQDSWKGYVPVYNLIVWLKIMKKPWWWILLLIVPGVNLLMLVIMHVELSKAFGQRLLKDTWLAIIFPMYVLIILAFKAEHEYVGPIAYDENNKKSRGKEWGDAIIFAIVAATIIRTFMLEAFTIPTPSMESSMLVGDYLFVSKMSYGPKLPNTPVSFPFAHHTLPLTAMTPSYVEWFSMPYMRLPGFGDVERNDVVVFNFPEGDTVIAENQAVSYYSEVRNRAFRLWTSHNNVQQASAGDIVRYEADRERYEQLAADNFAKMNTLMVRPVDKRENYIKRCVAIAGDEIEIIDRVIYINGEPGIVPENVMFSYPKVIGSVNPSFLKSKYGISEDNILQDPSHPGYAYGFHLTDSQHQQLAALPQYADLVASSDDKVAVGEKNQSMYGYFPIFPNDAKYNWTKDNFGPLNIPAAGETVELTLNNLPIYERLIDLYEGHDLAVKDGQIYIDGAVATTYTFAMNYYWLMGDNRHNSQDSRFWGFVPEDHVVGKAVFVWFSKDPQTGVRWSRVFSLVD